MLAYDGPSFMPRKVSSGEINRAHSNNTNKLVAGKAGQPIVCTNNTHGNLELVRQLQAAFDNATSGPSPNDDCNHRLTSNSTKQSDSISDHLTTNPRYARFASQPRLFYPFSSYFLLRMEYPVPQKLNSSIHKNLPLSPNLHPVFKKWICRHKRFFLGQPCVCLGI